MRNLDRTPIDFQDAIALIDELRFELEQHPDEIRIYSKKGTEFSLGEFPRTVNPGMTYMITVDTGEGGFFAFRSCTLLPGEELPCSVCVERDR